MGKVHLEFEIGRYELKLEFYSHYNLQKKGSQKIAKDLNFCELENGSFRIQNRFLGYCDLVSVLIVVK